MLSTSRPAGRRWRAFTLIELIVVVIIIAILAAIAGVAYNTFVSHARDTALQADAKQTDLAITARSAQDDKTPSVEVAAAFASGATVADTATPSSTAFATYFAISYDTTHPLVFTPDSVTAPTTVTVALGSRAACLTLGTEPGMASTITTGACATATPAPSTSTTPTTTPDPTASASATSTPTPTGSVTPAVVDPKAAPVITSISAFGSGATLNPAVVVTGSNFGSATNNLTAGTRYFSIWNVTRNYEDCSPTNWVHCNLTWNTDPASGASTLTLTGFNNEYGTHGWVDNNGDVLELRVWNANDAGPAADPSPVPGGGVGGAPVATCRITVGAGAVDCSTGAQATLATASPVPSAAATPTTTATTETASTVPVIQSISAFSSGKTLSPAVVIKGTGFGAGSTINYTGTYYFQVTNLTRSPNFMMCYTGNAVLCSLSYSQSNGVDTITLNGFGTGYGTNGWSDLNGDQIKITVGNTAGSGLNTAVPRASCVITVGAGSVTCS